MGLVTGEVFQASIQGTVAGQMFSVSQFYRATKDFSAAEGVGVAMDVWNLFKVAWRGLSRNTAQNQTQQVRVFSLTNPVGLGGVYSIPVLERTGTGTVTGDNMPAYVAFGVTLRGATRLVRPGSRRLPFVMEVDNVNGYVPGVTMTLVNALAEQFMEPLLSDDILIGGYGEPVLVGRTPEGAFDLARVQPIVSVFATDTLTSQVSRKPGRGM